VLWFAEIRRRQLYHDLGYASLHQYAAEALGFSASKTSQFMRLAEALDGLPALRESIASGQIGWTKAREVVKVATSRNEKRWLAEAKRSSRRDLERKIARVRANKRAARLEDPQQAVLPMDSAHRGGKADGQTRESRLIQDAAITSQQVTLRFAPQDYARFEGLLEKLWKVSARRRGAARLQKEQLVLAGLETLLSDEIQERACEREGMQRPAQPPHHETSKGATAHPDRGYPERNPGRNPERNPEGSPGRNPERNPERNFTRVKSASPYQIVIYKCEACGGGQVVTSRGRRSLSAAALAAASCDARILQQSRGEPEVPSHNTEANRHAAGGQHRASPHSRSTIPPAVRQAVLARDGHRCRAPGCGRAHFLEVHHIKPRAHGGKNDPDNLVTLCSACHRYLHERGSEITVLP
jgi:5-methylcytosine-specific restriction endonuclease McrA